MSPDIDNKVDASPTTPDESKPAVKRKRGQRMTRAEIEEQTEQRVRAQMQTEFDALKARLEALESQAGDTTSAEESVEDQLQPPEISAVDPKAQGAVTVHFVEDGMTILGKVWYRGEELTVAPDSAEWAALSDKSGRMLLTMTEDEQLDRWGKRMFRDGPWRGKGFELDDPNLSSEDRERLTAIQQRRLNSTIGP